MVSPVPTSLSTPTPVQASVVPYLGFPPSKKARFTDDADFRSPSKNQDMQDMRCNARDAGPDLKQHQGNNGNNAATAAAMLAANGYSAAFPFLQHLANNSNSSSQQQQQQQLAAAAAALGLPGLPSSRLVQSEGVRGRQVIRRSGWGKRKGDEGRLSVTGMKDKMLCC